MDGRADGIVDIVMMRNLLARAIARVIPCLLIVGCGQAANQNQAADVAAGVGGMLQGDWQVASLDGRSIIGVRLKGDDKILTWELACAGWSTPYQQRGTMIRFLPKKQPPGNELHVVCSIGYPPTVPQIFAALPETQQVEPIDANNVRLSGRRHSIILERPVALDQMAVPSLRGKWWVSELDGANILDRSLALEADETKILWPPACANQIRGYSIENDRISFYNPRRSPPPPPGATALPPPVCPLPLHSSLAGALANMDVATRIHQGADGHIVIDGGGHTMTLRPQSRGKPHV